MVWSARKERVLAAGIRLSKAPGNEPRTARALRFVARRSSDAEQRDRCALLTLWLMMVPYPLRFARMLSLGLLAAYT